jgi:hypothetical protein
VKAFSIPSELKGFIHKVFNKTLKKGFIHKVFNKTLKGSFIHKVFNKK